MAPSDAKRKANAKYLKEKTEALTIRVPKGEKESLKAYAATKKESLNHFVIRAIKETMERDKAK